MRRILFLLTILLMSHSYAQNELYINGDNNASTVELFISGLNGTSSTLFVNGEYKNVNGTVKNQSSLIKVSGDFTNITSTVGEYSSVKGQLHFVGTSNQTISGGDIDAHYVLLDNATGATISTGATLNIDSALVLTTGTFTAAPGSEVVLLSNIGGDAYLDDFTNPGVYGGNITVERYVTSGSGHGQRMFGSPVVGGVVSGLSQTYASGSTGQIVMSTCGGNVDVGSPYNNLFEWHEGVSSPNSCAFEAWFARNQSTPLDNGRGYSGWMNDGTVLSFTAAPNTGNVSYGGNLSNSAPGLLNKNGWHVLTNPYPSPVNMNALTSGDWSSLQTYDPGQAFAGTFQPIMPGQDLSIGQGFVAFTNVNNNTANYTNAMRNTGSTTFKNNDDWFISKLNIEVDGNGFKDISYIYFNDDATLGFDNQWDCVKKASDAGQPTLFTRIEGEKASLNGHSINDLGANSIPLGMAPGANGQFTFTVTGINSLPASTIVYLEDKATGTWTNLREQASYTFDMTETESEDRFEVHFTGPITVNHSAESCEGNDGTISVDFGNQSIAGNLLTWDYELNLDNQIVETSSETGIAEIFDLEPGDYELTFTNGTLQVTEWVTIEEKTEVEAEFTTNTNTLFTGDELIATNSSLGATSYTWEVNGETFTSTDLNYTFITSGTYVVSLFAYNLDCDAVYEETIVVENKTTGIAEQVELNNAIIYANDKTITVDLSNVKLNGKTDLEIYNLVGQLMVEKLNVSHFEYIEMDQATSGMYVVKIINQKESVSKKVILR